MRKFLSIVSSLGLVFGQLGVAEAKNPQREFYTFPVAKATYSRLFGWQDAEQKIFNDGVDLLAPAGSNVYAWSAGTVQSVAYNSQCGWQIVIVYKAWTTIYCNLSKEDTYPIGREIDARIPIGKLASPPGQKFAVLHWTLKEYGKLINPYEVAQDIEKFNKKNR